MAVIGVEALELLRTVRDHYPETYEWARQKARWEGIPLGAVFVDYRGHIEELMAKEGR